MTMHLYCVWAVQSLTVKKKANTWKQCGKSVSVYAIAPNIYIYIYISDNTVPIATATAIANCATVCEKLVASFLHLLSIHSLCLALYLSIFPSRSLCCVNLHLSSLHWDISCIFLIFSNRFCCAINVVNQWQRKPIDCYDLSTCFFFFGYLRKGFYAVAFFHSFG